MIEKCGWMNENLASESERESLCHIIKKTSCDLKRKQVSWNE